MDKLERELLNKVSLTLAEILMTDALLPPFRRGELLGELASVQEAFEKRYYPLEEPPAQARMIFGGREADDGEKPCTEDEER